MFLHKRLNNRRKEIVVFLSNKILLILFLLFIYFISFLFLTISEKHLYHHEEKQIIRFKKIFNLH